MTDSPSPQPPDDLATLILKYREVKHSVNNSLGVMMAMSELAQLNPNNVEKLIKIVIERGPQIVSQMQGFGADLQRLADLQGKKDE